MDALHKKIGQTVQVPGQLARGRARPAWAPGRCGSPGTTVSPAFGLPAFANTDLGSGAVVATSLLSGITGDTGCNGHITCYNYLLLRVRPGTDLGADAAVLSARAAQHQCPPGQVHGLTPPTSGPATSGTSRACGTPRSSWPRCSPCSPSAP